MELSRHVRRYVNSLLKTSLQAREFPILIRYYLIINVMKILYTFCVENSWQPEPAQERRNDLNNQTNSKPSVLPYNERRKIMSAQANSKSSVLPSNERRKVMNTQIQSTSMKPMIRFIFILFAILVLSSCSSGDRTASTSCSIGERVTIDVTDARPREVFDLLSKQLNCKITVYPFFMHTVTVHMENVRASEILVAVIPQLDAKWIYNVDGRLSIMPLTPTDKRRANAWEETNRKFETRLPEGMVFENVPMSTVLAEISNASGLELTPMEGEGDRLVTIDVSGMTVQDALEAVVRDVDGEGHVVVKTWNGYAQRGIVDRP
jgi:hypothetical protein